MTNKTSPISVRFSRDELKQIARAAQKLNLSRSQFIRLRTLGAEAISSRNNKLTRQKTLAQILGKLGHSSLSASLSDLSDAARCGHLIIDEEMEARLKVACADISEIRQLLLKALGLRPNENTKGK